MELQLFSRNKTESKKSVRAMRHNVMRHGRLRSERGDQAWMIMTWSSFLFVILLAGVGYWLFDAVTNGRFPSTENFTAVMSAEDSSMMESKLAIVQFDQNSLEQLVQMEEDKLIVVKDIIDGTNSIPVFYPEVSLVTPGTAIVEAEGDFMSDEGFPVVTSEESLTTEPLPSLLDSVSVQQ